MRQTFKGVIVSAFNPKTVKVRTTIQVRHPKVLKVITRHKDYMAHDETNALGIGDTVRIEACRPISASKRFAVAEVLQKSKVAEFLAMQEVQRAKREAAVNNGGAGNGSGNAENDA